MSEFLRSLKYSSIGRILTVPLRVVAYARYLSPDLLRALRWMTVSKEWSNFSVEYSEGGLIGLWLTLLRVAPQQGSSALINAWATRSCMPCFGLISHEAQQIHFLPRPDRVAMTTSPSASNLWQGRKGNLYCDGAELHD